MSVKTELHQIFCDNLKSLRAKLGLTQEQAAEKMGVTQSTYSSYESGKGSPTLDLVERLADVLEVDDPSRLLRRSRRAVAG